MGTERRYMRRVSAVRCENRHTKHTHRLGVELSAAPPNIIKTDKTHSRCGFRKTSRAAHGLTAMAYCGWYDSHAALLRTYCCYLGSLALCFKSNRSANRSHSMEGEMNLPIIYRTHIDDGQNNRTRRIVDGLPF